MIIKLTEQEKLKIKQFTKNLVESRLITEAFASKKLADLHKVLIKTKAYIKSEMGKLPWGEDITKIWNGMANSGVPVSEIPDSNVIVTQNPNEAKKYMKSDPNAVVFVVGTAPTSKYKGSPVDGILLAALKDMKNLYIYGVKQTYNSNKDSWKDDKASSKQFTQSTGQMYNGGSGVDRSIGARRTGGISNSDVYKAGNTFYIVLTPNDDVKTGNRLASQEKFNVLNQVFMSNDDFRKINRERYAHILKQMRSLKRQDQDLSLVEYEKLNSIRPRIEAAMTKVMDDPIGHKYKDLDHSVSYGEGRNIRTYTTSLLKLYTEMHSGFAEYLKDFKDGNKTSSGKSAFNEAFLKLEKLLTRLGV